MTTVTQDNASVEIHAFKAGLLSAVGHDVKLRVSRFSITFDADEPSATATFDPRSIVAVCAIKNGEDDLAALSAKDLETINGYVNKDILRTSRHPEITFETSDMYDEGDGSWEIEGDLSLHGSTRPLTISAELDGDHIVGELTLNQPAFGIKPFKAMMGALKIRPDVTIIIRVPASALQ